MAEAETETTPTQHRLMFIGGSVIPHGDFLAYDTNRKPVRHGATFSVDDDKYQELVSSPYTAGLIKEVDTDYSKMSRGELEKKAREAGVENPKDLEAYPTNESLAAAIEDADETVAEPKVQVPGQAGEPYNPVPVAPPEADEQAELVPVGPEPTPEDEAEAETADASEAPADQPATEEGDE